MIADQWHPQAVRVEETVRRIIGHDLTGVYVHGSAALGGWTPASDLDVLVTTNTTASDNLDWAEIGQILLSSIEPAPVLELSIVRATEAELPEPPWPFLLHVNQKERRVVSGEDALHGDPDLLMHYLVAGHSGITITGPPAGLTFGTVPRTTVLTYLHDELTWALHEADERYAVLNACRARAYAEAGLILSKVDGARWGIQRGLDHGLVERALAAQVDGRDLGPPSWASRRFVEDCITAVAAH